MLTIVLGGYNRTSRLALRRLPRGCWGSQGCRDAGVDEGARVDEGAGVDEGEEQCPGSCHVLIEKLTKFNSATLLLQYGILEKLVTCIGI